MRRTCVRCRRRRKSICKAAIGPPFGPVCRSCATLFDILMEEFPSFTAARGGIRYNKEPA